MNVLNDPLVSIILLNYNGIKYVDLWNSVLKQDYDNYEIIFVDNGSVDGSADVFKARLRENDPPVEFLRLPKNVGYSKANDLGLELTKGKYVVLLSNDIEVQSTWLRNMVDHLESNPEIGVAQSMMFSIFNREVPDKMGNYIDVLGFNYPFVPTGEVKEVFYSEGAVMFIRRELIEKAGGLFDEDFFMFFEDVDFCWRIRLLGYNIVVVPSSIVYHVRGGTVPGVLVKNDRFYASKNCRNRLVTLFKNFDSPRMLIYVPISATMETILGIWLILMGKKGMGEATIEGVWQFLRSIPALSRKRRAIQRSRVVSDAMLMKNIVPMRGAISNLFSNSRQFKSELMSEK